MLWFLSIPVIVYFTFVSLMHSGFPEVVLCPDGYRRNFLEWCFLIFVGCVLSVLISLVPVGISVWIGSLPEIHGIKDTEYPLVALREKDGMAGRFYFLGAGSINSAEYYFWYRKNPNGSVSGGKTYRSPGVEVYEHTGEPIMITFKTEYKNKLAKYIWIIGLDIRKEGRWWPWFYIPKGSIKEGFVL